VLLRDLGPHQDVREDLPLHLLAGLAPLATLPVLDLRAAASSGHW
jgi:hypothetical protein